MSASEPHITSLNVGGLAVHVFSNPLHLHESLNTLPITALFLLHGRLSSKDASVAIAKHALRYALDQINTAGADSISHELIVITLDHRNHGARTVDEFANKGWHVKPEKHNVRHAIDMYAIQSGTAQDVSFLIDFLPSYLYPNGERAIDTWAVGGVSLGGHSTWQVLKDDPRVTIGIPIIGCPDFLKLMSARAAQFSAKKASTTTTPADSTSSLSDLNSPAPWAFPRTLLAQIAKTSPAPSDSPAQVPPSYSPYAHDPKINPFIGKRILVLSGAVDPLVPWSASEEFVDKLYVGDEGDEVGKRGGGKKKVVLEEGAAHECTPRMVAELARFVWEEGLVARKVPV